MTTHVLVAVAILAVASLGAQTPSAGGASGQSPKVEQGPKIDSKVEERSQAMRNQIGTGRQVQSHVRVAVRLKNGNRLKGVVKDGRLVERVDGLRFVDAQAQEPGAGIRLWYSGGARNYVFLPFDGLAEYQVLQRLTPEQLEQIENEMQMSEAKQKEAMRAAAEAQKAATGETTEAQPQDPAVQGTEKPAPAGEPKYETPQRRAANKAKAEAEAKAAEEKDGKTAAAAQQATQKMWYQLLQEYPPAGGWNQARRDEIARRKVVVGAVPSASEQRFVEKFEDWKKACAHFAAGTEAKKAEAGAEGKTEAGTEGKTETGTETKTEPVDESVEAERRARRGKK
jgi:hypothetical protein